MLFHGVKLSDTVSPFTRLHYRTAVRIQEQPIATPQPRRTRRHRRIISNTLQEAIPYIHLISQSFVMGVCIYSALNWNFYRKQRIDMEENTPKNPLKNPTSKSDPKKK